MKRKIVLLLVSCLMAVSLVLASCAPAVVEEEEKPPVVEEKKPVVEEKKPVVPEKEMVKDSLGRLVEKPQYGGTITYVFYKPQLGWDTAYCPEKSVYRINLVFEDLQMGDWTKGPYGTGEFAWEVTGPPMPENAKYGLIAESWERKDPVTKIYHIRKGIHFHNKPPTNGRELTADDVVATINYYYSVPSSSLRGHTPGVPTSVQALDRYTVELKWPDAATAMYGFLEVENNCKIFAADAIEKYGHMRDWRNVIGTGPFMPVDEVAGTSTLMVRNPNFWEKDPMHPDLDLQLPYPDAVRWVIIMDESTRLAAIRTGKATLCRGIDWEDAEHMKLTRPDLQYHGYSYTATYAMPLRQDDPEAPWIDKRVRHALWLAMDSKLIVDEFFGGHADLLAHPILPLADYKDWYVPVEELPKETRELFEYHPDKAKQLMAEAGYADGFKFEVVCRAKDVDMLSMIKAMWAEINVDLIIDVKESGVFYSIRGARSWKHSIYVPAATTNEFTFSRFFHPTLTGTVNYPRVDDPKLNENREKIEEAMLAGDFAEISRLIKGILPYIHDQAYFVQPPNFHLFYLAQPWLKRFTGQYSPGITAYYTHFRYLWVDTEMQKEMGY